MVYLGAATGYDKQERLQDGMSRNGYRIVYSGAATG